MRITDYIEQACGNLWKKKLRTFHVLADRSIRSYAREYIF